MKVTKSMILGHSRDENDESHNGGITKFKKQFGGEQKTLSVPMIM